MVKKKKQSNGITFPDVEMPEMTMPNFEFNEPQNNVQKTPTFEFDDSQFRENVKQWRENAKLWQKRGQEIHMGMKSAAKTSKRLGKQIEHDKWRWLIVCIFAVLVLLFAQILL